MMERGGRSAGKIALYVLFALFAVLVLINGIMLLCESDPAKFYASMF
jgi:hypothetical protein